MTYDLDIYRSAKLLIDQHGKDASGFAVKQADKQAEAGDMEGKAVWLRILNAVKELQQREPGERAAEAEGQAPGQGAVDDLTAIRGIGIVMQDRLNRVGITNYAKLAKAKPEHVREALGELSRGIKIEALISQAQELAARTR